MRAGRIALVAVIAAVAGCSAGHPSAVQLGQGAAAAAVTASAPAAPSLTQVQECTTVVTKLLEQSQQAVEDGYPGGISLQAVEEQYGVRSAVFQAFEMLDPAEIAYFAEYGTGGGDAPQVLQTQQECEQYEA